MYKITCLLLLIFMVKTYSQEAPLPFSFHVRERTTDLPTDVSPAHPNSYNSDPDLMVGWGIDYLIRHVIIDDEDRLKFSSSFFEAGSGDFDFYVDYLE